MAWEDFEGIPWNWTEARNSKEGKLICKKENELISLKNKNFRRAMITEKDRSSEEKPRKFIAYDLNK